MGLTQDQRQRADMLMQRADILMQQAERFLDPQAIKTKRDIGTVRSFKRKIIEFVYQIDSEILGEQGEALRVLDAAIADLEAQLPDKDRTKVRLWQNS